MANEEFFKKLINNINKNKTISASKLVKHNPTMAAVVSKLINPKAIGAKHLYKPENLNSVLSSGKLTNISNSVTTRYLNNKNMLELFPDLERAMQILVSSILSPKDMVESKLIYSVEEPVFSLDLTGQILNEVKLYLNKVYQLDESLPKILEEALFMKGASIKAILPEASIDSIINDSRYTGTLSTHGAVKVSQESFKDVYSNRVNGTLLIKSLNILGNYSKVATESHDIGIYENERSLKVIDTHIEISDNFQLLKVPLALESIRKANILDKFRPKVGNESQFYTSTDIDNKLFKSVDSTAKLVEFIPTANELTRKSVGKPLVLNLPSESVIPVCLPNEPSKHLGYFIIVDENGNPISAINTDSSYINSMISGSTTNSTGDTSMSSYLLQKARANLKGSQYNDNQLLDNVMLIYTGLVEDNLKKRLSNGFYDDNVSIADNDEIYKIMLARSLANKFTKIVYVPVEFMSYFAFDYYDNGIGKSLLDNLAIITGLRAMMMFAKINAYVKSAINITTVNLKLDEDDPDPQRTIEVAMHEVMKMRQQFFPLGINSAPDLVDWVQRAGMEFTFEGHPGIPDVKLDFDIKNMNHTIPNSELDDDLRKQTYMALGLSPETIDNGFNSEFATTIVSNNILLAKMVSVYQTTFSKLLRKHIQRLLTFDATMQSNIRDLIVANLKSFTKTIAEDDKELFKRDKVACIDKYIQMFIGNIEVTLPKPDETTLDTQMAAYDTYAEALDKTLDNWISAEVANDTLAGDMSQHMDTLKNTVRTFFLRRNMTDNNFMPELTELITTNEDGKPSVDLFDVSKAHIDSLMRSCYKFIESMQPIKEIVDTKLEEEGIEQSEQVVDSGDDSGSDDSGFGDELGGMDDLGMDDVEMEETETTEATDETESEETNEEPPTE